MTDYCLTAWSTGLGWRDIQVLRATDMHEAIRLAERASGCRVSHARSGEQTLFDPGLVVDAETGQVVERHTRAAKPEVVAGPPDVMRLIAMALKPPKTAGARR